ncbi:hypothetical protein [Caulobacter radicis]|uniref:Uncharacterized protein n=1 Tax=Caulobacter radicis TaxID=2172650 RepID=A0A2T9IVZ8_9CAUL|nr:hypothetical protein [Caulobacter radicis]PVM70959.1 hypothetical protein DDF65_25390 [Caulobacter radicis]PVM87700.1 hypothetical protein DDF62_16425 [Caulobacter radicis]
MSDKPNTELRQSNAALPPGERPGLVSEKGTVRTGKAEQKAAGPDGPSAAEVGDTFKGKAP